MAGISSFALPTIKMGSSVIPTPVLYLLIGIIVILVILIAFMFLSGRDVPSIGETTRARRLKKPLGRLHFPDGTEKSIVLEPELIGGNDTMNKTFGKGKPTNYHRADGLIKFWDTTGQAAERADGIIPVYNLLMNIPESVAVRWAAIMDALEKELANAGHNIDGVQDLFFYCLKELDATAVNVKQPATVSRSEAGTLTIDQIKAAGKEKKDAAVSLALDGILKYIQVNDEASKDRVKMTIEYLYDHSDEINYRMNRPITFTWQSLIRSWDAMQGATSRNVEQIKICAEEEAKLGNEKKDMSVLMYALGFAIVIGILVFAGKAFNWF